MSEYQFRKIYTRDRLSLLQSRLIPNPSTSLRTRSVSLAQDKENDRPVQASHDAPPLVDSHLYHGISLNELRVQETRGSMDLAKELLIGTHSQHSQLPNEEAVEVKEVDEQSAHTSNSQSRKVRFATDGGEEVMLLDKEGQPEPATATNYKGVHVKAPRPPNSCLKKRTAFTATGPRVPPGGKDTDRINRASMRLGLEKKGSPRLLQLPQLYCLYHRGYHQEDSATPTQKGNKIVGINAVAPEAIVRPSQVKGLRNRWTPLNIALQNYRPKFLRNRSIPSRHPLSSTSKGSNFVENLAWDNESEQQQQSMPRMSQTEKIRIASKNFIQYEMARRDLLRRNIGLKSLLKKSKGGGPTSQSNLKTLHVSSALGKIGNESDNELLEESQKHYVASNLQK
ncbi:unnamed protein product [Orchesella dallaii]|uniref:Uncharacterized protein n=1 Tax=Orchesella dallaii TaxID=48710 RepID=A0ABP1RC23_9HEXA